MKQVAIFASGTGSNFEAIVDDVRLKDYMEVKLLVCDQAHALVIDKAKKRNIETFVFSAQNFKNKNEYEKIILEKVKDFDFIFLAGYMRLISSEFLNTFKKPILNIHPSLLPKYKGKDAILQAYNQNEQIIGVTIHYVNEEMDGGEIIASDSIKVEENESLASVTKRIHQLEHQLYPKIILELVRK